ncbi:MAG: discoidin domain-containing protein, partial [Actinomadura sp.]
GSFNWMIFEDVAGMRPRADDTIELSPIGIGYDHFAVGNLTYHGSDLSIVWQRPGGPRHYPSAPFGYSLYLDGERAFTVDDLAGVRWNSRTGAVQSAAKVLSSARLPVREADEVSLTGNARLVDGFQKAGLDLEPGAPRNLAEGRPATASFTTTSPAAQATDPANAVDGFTISGLPVTQGSFVGTNPIWGDLGSPNAQDWLQVDLGGKQRFDHVKLYFYSNKAFGVGGGTYREPAAYTVQYFDGSAWVDVLGQVKSPATPAPNHNEVRFAPVTARQVRVLMDRAPGLAVGLKEIQVLSR